ncbi:hypothetical protein HDU82_005475 [Entophlyctis luteolus]|nr:hypothetical protein HDU82_005475 [Entophlyctis luteolus]
MLHRRIGSVWAAAPAAPFDLMTPEGVSHVVFDRDVVCWRSDADRWPQPLQSLLQTYLPTGTRRLIKLPELTDPLEFERYDTKPDVFIMVRVPLPAEHTLTLANGEIQKIDHELDCIAQRVNWAGDSLGSEYILKKSVLAEMYARV